MAPPQMTEQHERTPPTPAEEAERAAERAICGAILDDPHGLHFAAALRADLTLDALQHPAHRAIWRAVAELREQGRAVDLITVSAALAPVLSRPAYRGYDSAWLAALPQAPARPESTAEHARIIVHGEHRRRLGRSLEDLTARHQAGQDLGDLPERLAELHRQGGAARTLRSRIAADITPEEIMWLWPRRIPMGMLTVIDGAKGQGKSTVAIDIVARYTTGRPMPGGIEARTPGRAIIWDLEDSSSRTICPRLGAAKADLQRVRIIEDLISIPDDTEVIEAQIRADGAGLLIISPLTAALSGRVDSHRDQDVRRALMPLVEMAERTGCAILAIRHLRKGAGPAIDRGLGSVAISAVVRSVLTVGTDPNDASWRIIAAAAGNVAQAPPSMTYRLESCGAVARVAWGGESPVTADELCMEEPTNKEDRHALREAEDVLRSILEAGTQPAKEIEAQAREVGVSPRTLRRARRSLGVRLRREGYGPGSRIMWHLPQDEDNDG